MATTFVLLAWWSGFEIVAALVTLAELAALVGTSVIGLAVMLT